MIEGIRTSIRQWFEDLFGVRQDALCRYMARLTRTIRDHGITLAYSNIIGPAQGMSVGGLIVLRTDLNPLEELLTLIHEFSHELLHQERPPQLSVTQREAEAEAVTSAVRQRLGLDPDETPCTLSRKTRMAADKILTGLLAKEKPYGDREGSALSFNRQYSRALSTTSLSLPKSSGK